MGRRDEILARAKAAQRWEREQQKLKKADEAMKPSELDCEKMPFGCWLWIAIAIFLVVVAVSKLSAGIV